MKDFNKEVAVGIKKGDYACFNRLFFAYYPRLCAYVTEIVEDPFLAEDVVQDFFVHLWMQHAKIDIRGDISAYLFRSVRNMALNQLRTENNRRKIIENKMIDLPEPDDISEPDDVYIRILTHCINELPPRCKEIFLLSRFDGLKQKEIAGQLDISLKTINNQLWKGLEYLKICVNGKMRN